MTTQTLQLQQGGGAWTVTKMALVGGGVSALILLFNSSRKSKRNINNSVFQGVTRNETLENETQETKSPLPDDEFVELTTNSNTIEGSGTEKPLIEEFEPLDVETNMVTRADNIWLIRDFLAHFKHGNVEGVGGVVEPGMELAAALNMDEKKAKWIHRMQQAEKQGIIKFNTHNAELPYNLYAVRDYIWQNATQIENRLHTKSNGLYLSKNTIAKNYTFSMIDSLETIESVFNAWFQNIKIGRRFQRAVKTTTGVTTPPRRYLSIIGLSERGEELDLGIEIEVGILGQLANEGFSLGENLPPKGTNEYHKLVDFAVEKINGWELPLTFIKASDTIDLFEYLNISAGSVPYTGANKTFTHNLLTVQKVMN
jgi:hypothetical protein